MLSVRQLCSGRTVSRRTSAAFRNALLAAEEDLETAGRDEFLWLRSGPDPNALNVLKGNTLW